MAKFSANLGFLWTELELPEAIRAAARCGFDAVECHQPYAIPSFELKKVLEETGLPMVGLNTEGGEDGNGLAGVPGMEKLAEAAIEQAVDYATVTGTSHVHVLAGCSAETQGARQTYVANLKYATALAANAGVNLVIEPLNHRDAPGYFLNSVEQAIDVIDEVGASNLRLMFDCYHVQILQGDLTKRLEACMPHIGHIQFASVPDRHEPDEGEVSYERLVAFIDRLGYEGFIGAEYQPRRGTEEGLGWLKWFGG